jgi:hypothetical protein
MCLCVKDSDVFFTADTHVSYNFSSLARYSNVEVISLRIAWPVRVVGTATATAATVVPCVMQRDRGRVDAFLARLKVGGVPAGPDFLEGRHR